jgi:hypothetical protein
MPHRKPKEYQLVCLITGESHGGYDSLEDARAAAHLAGLASWDILRGNERIEHHDPLVSDPPQRGGYEPDAR